MVWSFLWRWVLGTTVLGALAVFALGFVYGLFFGGSGAAPILGSMAALLVATVIAAVWAANDARRR
jgi:hypothetical protein